MIQIMQIIYIYRYLEIHNNNMPPEYPAYAFVPLSELVLCSTFCLLKIKVTLNSRISLNFSPLKKSLFYKALKRRP